MFIILILDHYIEPEIISIHNAAFYSSVLFGGSVINYNETKSQRVLKTTKEFQSKLIYCVPSNQ